jgi:hypothetical protein
MSRDPRPSSVEFDLLCAVVGPHPDLRLAREMLRGAIDFPALLELALEHRVRPRLLLGLSELSWEGVPAATRATLEDFRQRHVLRVLYLAEELGHLAEAFASGGIRFAAFKGAVLAVDLYGDLSQREYSDIDLVVPRSQVADAEAVLEKRGYVNRQGDRAFRKAFLAYQRQYSFIRTDIDAEIDLHWGFTIAQLPFPLRPDDVWSDLKSVRVGAHAISTLSDANLALLLAGHGTKEVWKTLGWICDFALLIDRRPDLDWAGLHERARRQGCGDTLLLGCALAAALLRTPVPRDLAGEMERSRRVRQITAAILTTLHGGLAAMSGRQNLKDLDLCDRRWDRLKAVIGIALTPTPGDYRALPLPPPLWRAYYLLRPVRLGAKAFAALLPRSLRGNRQPMVGQ